MCVCVCVSLHGVVCCSKRQWLNPKHVLVVVYLSINAVFAFLTEVYCSLPLSHMRSHAHTHTHITHYVLFVDMPFLVHIIPICFAKSGWFSHFCLLSLPMESNFCIHNSSAQWGPCNEFYLATMFMFLLTLADNFTALCVCAHIILT